jgi:hypothetical protein
MDGVVATTFGKVNHRFENVEVMNGTKKEMQLHREGDHNVSFDIRTTTGTIFMKDSE